MKLMKQIFFVAGALLFAACASDQPAAPTVSSASARYATPDENAELQKQARANFERAREQHGMLATIGSGPATTTVVAPPVETRRAAPVISVASSSSKPVRRNWPVSEARYAMEIGKSPADLTAGERAAAHSE